MRYSGNRDFQRCLMEIGRLRDWPLRESLCNLRSAHTSLDGANLIRPIVDHRFRLLGETYRLRRGRSTPDMLSSEEASVDGPGTWSNHR